MNRNGPSQNTGDGGATAMDLGFFEPAVERMIIDTEDGLGNLDGNSTADIPPPVQHKTAASRATDDEQFGDRIEDIRAPTFVELEKDTITEIARSIWQTSSIAETPRKGGAGKFDRKIVEQIWDEELEGNQFSLRKIMLLEFSQYLENYLWPNFTEDSSVAYVLSIVLMINEKIRQRTLDPWSGLAVPEQKAKFSSFFFRVLKLLIGDYDDQRKLTLKNRRFLLIFLIHAFQSLENVVIREECMKLVGISIWHGLISVDRREMEFERDGKIFEAWARAEKRFAKRDDKAKERSAFERSFFSKMIKSYYTILFSISGSGPASSDTVLYCERFIELVIDLLSQLPTRRFFNTLVDDHLLVDISFSSGLAERGRNALSRPYDELAVENNTNSSGAAFFNMLFTLEFYARFEISDTTGEALKSDEILHEHYLKVRRLQKLAFVKYRDDLEDFALANVGNVDSIESMRRYLGDVKRPEVLISLCKDLNIRTSSLLSRYEIAEEQQRWEISIDPETRNVTAEQNSKLFGTDFLVDVLFRRYGRRARQIDQINATPIYPNEEELFNDTIAADSKNFTNSHCLPIPKLNLQFLTVHDYLLRNYNLYRLESIYSIRQDLEDVVRRLAPRYNPEHQTVENRTAFDGWARMAVPIDKLEIVQIGAPKLGDSKPSSVLADVSFSVGSYTDSIRAEWDSLRPHDVVFLLSLQAAPDLPGWAEHQLMQEKLARGILRNEEPTSGQAFRRKWGLRYVRACEVIDKLGDDGRAIEESKLMVSVEDGTAMEAPRIVGKRRTLRVAFDTNQYALDTRLEGADVYGTLNVIMRRKPAENNFKAVLESIRDLMQSEAVVPSWLQDVFLGYGDPASANFRRMGRNAVTKIDFRDTFLDWEHLVQSFPNQNIVAKDGKTAPPPYLLTFPNSMFDGSNEGVKGKGGVKLAVEEQIIAETYKVGYMGPYPEDVPKRNTIRFTPAQVEAIHAGTSPGLTMIVGPPGTGKTDVAVQIIANLYHNFPREQVLIVTHSNQALNQLFEKILNLDIDPRHLLRLGHGEEGIEVEGSWGKYGRVNSFLEKRIQLLWEVDRLAASLSVPGAHGNSCETAGYFYTYHVQGAWEQYEHLLRKAKENPSNIGEEDCAKLVSSFPFAAFFANAPQQPLFPPRDTKRTVGESVLSYIEIAEGCYRHVEKVFSQLEEMRAFELLRTHADRSNYLLVKEARIVALTCTHAALKRRELVRLGFRYDSIVMEEAAQILEVETFIPLLLQAPVPADDKKTGNAPVSRLKRVVLIGDHHQLPPVVQQPALQRYANMEQSLFSRFVRLGVPTVQLDRQGRSRKSLAELFRWKYGNLGDLDVIGQGISTTGRPSEYGLANPGFAFDYQVVNVDGFMGKGEHEPIHHFIQNLGEAEYVVAVFMYMRLLGYPAERIAILTTYNGQKELINDVVTKRCAWHPLFGKPGKISTVDKFQGQQADYVLLSLVRTKTVGHLRDVRRLIVAMSRARLGLYIFCRVKLFADCVELRPVFERLVEKRPWEHLWVRPNEMYAARQTVLEGEEGEWMRHYLDTGLECVSDGKADDKRGQKRRGVQKAAAKGKRQKSKRGSATANDQDDDVEEEEEKGLKRYERFARVVEDGTNDWETSTDMVGKKRLWRVIKRPEETDEEAGVFGIEGVEHMGAFVQQMMEEHVEWLKNRDMEQPKTGVEGTEE
ncbi:intron-binding protein aquarius-like protein [Cladochytrium replicatum]|nr:intron-binding protein aquarius-like protein [Cladochytrium replicatum]